MLSRYVVSSGQLKQSPAVESEVKNSGSGVSAAAGTQSFAYSIYDCWWADSIDKGCDGFTQYRRLCVDVDVDDGSTRNVFLKIYRKAASSLFWVLYCTTSNFAISGYASTDYFWVSIGAPNTELSRDSYDFIIEVWETGGTAYVTFRGAAVDADLQGQHFETSAEDAAGCPYVFGDCAWTSVVDENGDGYAQSRQLWIDIQHLFGPTYAGYLKVYLKATAASTYELYFTTLAYTFFAPQNILNVYVGATNPELFRGAYDFKVELWAAGNWKAVLTRGPEDDPDLHNQLFERSAVNAVDDAGSLPLAFHLEQNYPNPFNPSTTIGFTVAGAKTGSGSTSIGNSPSTIDIRLGSRVVRLAVYDMLGREVAVLVNEPRAPGEYHVTFNGTGLGSGVYLCRFSAGGYVETKRMLLVR
jgi:hypothetical protein